MTADHKFLEEAPEGFDPTMELKWVICRATELISPPEGQLTMMNCNKCGMRITFAEADPRFTTIQHIVCPSEAERSGAPQAGTVALAACRWKEDADTWSWDTICGGKFQFTNDGPNENGYRFCPACGKPIALAGELFREPGGATHRG